MPATVSSSARTQPRPPAGTRTLTQSDSVHGETTLLSVVGMAARVGLSPHEWVHLRGQITPLTPPEWREAMLSTVEADAPG